MIKAVIFDLDDTLCPEIEYVKSGFSAVAKYLDNPDMYDIFWNLFQEDKMNVYQRAGLRQDVCGECIEIYRNHMPVMKLPEDSKLLIDFLKSKDIKLGIITDGRPEGQRNKIKALGLDALVDEIIITDELGGIEYRKPNKKSFEIMREKLDVEFDEMVYVGDNPAKDFHIKSVYPIKTVRLITSGIYKESDYLDGINEDIRIFNLEELLYEKDLFCGYNI